MPSWQQLKIIAKAEYADMLTDLLNEANALAITFEDAQDQPLYEPELDTTPLWKQTQIIALFEEGDDLAYLLQKIQQHAQISYTMETLKDQDWVQKTQQDFPPLKFGKRLWICPSWQNLSDISGIIIRLDPGLAFGTGTHPTTALCLEWLEENLQGNPKVLDYGCGSGILAIAALKLGAKMAWAVDHDPQAIEATQENGRNNQLYPPTLVVTIPEKLPSWTPDILLANILAQPLINLSEKFSQLLIPGGKLVLSGILQDQIAEVVAAYSPCFEIIDIISKEEWIRIAAKRR
jgi:ribosomal protein L11 methyltransferase